MNESDVYDFTLLIAEDTNSNYKLLEASVGQFFRKVIRANNGYEAIEAMRTNENIGLIIMDLSMPEMNGYNATRNIRSFRPDIPVIAVTAYVGDETIEQINEAGFNEYLLKPFLSKDLMNAIRRSLPSSQQNKNEI